MKKPFLIILITLISGYLKAQVIQLPLKDSSIYYEGVVRLQDSTMSADKLFALAQTWFANTFKSSNSVLQVNDRQTGKLIGKGTDLLYGGYGSNPPTFIVFTVSIDVKPGRYRYRLYDIGFEAGTNTVDASPGYSHYLHGEIHKQVLESKKQALRRYEHDYGRIQMIAESMISSLKKYMSNVNADAF